MSTNQAKKPRVDKSDPHDPVFDPECVVGVIPPGVLVNLKGVVATVAGYPLGALWVWTRSEEQHYLLQQSHRKHIHRVQGVFWTAVIASCVRGLIDSGMRSGDIGVYTMLREAGIIPIDWHKPVRKKLDWPKPTRKKRK